MISSVDPVKGFAAVLWLALSACGGDDAKPGDTGTGGSGSGSSGSATGGSGAPGSSGSAAGTAASGAGTGGQGSGTGGSEPAVTMSKRAACIEYVRAFCLRSTECGNYDSAEGCIELNDDDCPDLAFSPGSTRFLDGAQPEPRTGWLVGSNPGRVVRDGSLVGSLARAGRRVRGRHPPRSVRHPFRCPTLQRSLLPPAQDSSSHQHCFE